MSSSQTYGEAEASYLPLQGALTYLHAQGKRETEGQQWIAEMALWTKWLHVGDPSLREFLAPRLPGYPRILQQHLYLSGAPEPCTSLCEALSGAAQASEV